MKTQPRSNLETLAINFAKDVEGVVRADLYRKLNIKLPTAPSVRVRMPGDKRTPEELEDLCQAVLTALRATPNIGVEELASVLSCSSRELTLPIRKLRMQKKITVKGQKRATRYALAR